MKNLLKSICFVALLIISNLTSAQSLQKGYDAFIANDHDKAIEYFEEAKSNPSEKGDALLMLSLIYNYNSKDDIAYKSITEYLKTSTEPEAVLNVLWTDIIFGGYGKLSSGQISLLNSIIKDKRYSGYIKTRANYSLGKHFNAIGDFKKAQTYFNTMKTITEFSIVGSFENISASGFNKEFGPLENPKEGSMFQNKRHTDVTWFKVNYLPGAWINYGSHFSTANSIFYAQTFCQSATEQQVNLSLGTSGSVMVWINDNLVFSEEEERNNDLDTYVLPVTLSAGENRILIKIGASEIGSANFMMRFTDEAGNSINDLKYTAYSTSGYSKKYAGKTSISAKKSSTMDYLEKKIKDTPNALVNYILIAKRLLSNDFNDEAREYIEKAQKFAPDCSYLLFQKMLVYLADDNRTALSESLEKMRKIDPNNILSMNLEYNEAKTAENWSKCTEIIESIEKKSGEDENVFEKKIEIASQEKRINDIITLCGRAFKLFPDNLDFLELQCTIETEVNKNPNAATKLKQNYLKTNYNISVMQSLAQSYFNQGTSSSVAKGMALLKKVATDQPNRADSYNTLAGVHFALKDYSTAIEYYQECLKIAPYIGDYNSDLALCYEEKGDEDLAKEYYQKAIAYYPNDYETRASLRKLDGKDDIWTIFGEPDLYKLLDKKIEKSDYPEDNSAILHYEGQRVIYPGGGSEMKFFIAVKTLNVEGVDRWKEYYIGVSNDQSVNVEKAEIIKANGNRIKAEVNYNAVVYTGLEPGDGIVLIYKIQNFYAGKLSENFWDKHVLNSYFPIEKSKFQLMVPKQTIFDHKVNNMTLDPVKTTTDEFDKYVWEVEKQPSLKSESFSAPLTDVGKTLFISSFPSWDYISKWYSDLAITKSKTSPEVKSTYAKIVEGNENASDYIKAKLIYNYIVKEIRYSSINFRQSGLIPQKASDVITTKIGDCKDVSTLFVALCKEAGIPAQLVLVNTRDNGANDMMLPSIEFNHCIAKVYLENKAYYVELTSDNYPFSTMGDGLKNAFSLDINDSLSNPVEPRYLNPTTRTKNLSSRVSDIKFDGSKMIVNKKSYKVGDLAASMRYSFRHLGKDEQFKEMTESVSGEYQSLKMKELKFDENLDSSNDTVSYSYSYEVNNVFNTIGDLSIMKLPLTDGFEPFEVFSNEKRVFDIMLWEMVSSDLVTETITVEVPKGKKLADVPKSVTYKSSFAEYTLTFTKNANNTLTIKREFKVLNDVIKVSQYEEAKKFFEDVVTADKQQIGFKNITP